MPQVSVIVPIYNVEAYLGDCLESLRNQTLDDIEVLCVVDGSMDGSERIARAVSGRDRRFRVLVKENGGLSSARNYGIDHANGDIVMFLDADDLFEPQCCKSVADAMAASDADVAVFGGKVFPQAASTDWYERVLSPVAARYDVPDPRFAFEEYATPYAWRCAVRRELLLREGLRFDETLPFGEDVVFQFALYPRSSRIVVLEGRFYLYRLDREGSLMDAHREVSRRLRAHLEIVSRVFGEWQALGLVDSYAEELKAWSAPYLMNDADQLPDDVRRRHLSEVGLLWDRYFKPGVLEAARVSLACLCRGDGKLYALYDIEASLPFTDLQCIARCGDVAVPANAYAFTGGGEGLCQRWVVELPLLQASSINLALRPDGLSFEQALAKVSFAKAKWLSRLNYRLKAAQAAAIRDYEKSFTDRRYQLDVFQRFDAGRCAVWRLEVRWVGDASRVPSLTVLDGHGGKVDAESMLFELQPADEIGVCAENVLVVSVRVPVQLDHFVAIAHDPSQVIASGFTVVDGQVAEVMKRRTADLMLAAGDDVGAYRSWFARNRVQPGTELVQRRAWSRKEVGAASFSVVVLPRDGAHAGLDDTLESLRGQTCGCWEAIVAGFDDDLGPWAGDGHVRAVGGGIARAVEIVLADAKGAQVAFIMSGDVLEPDALFEYAHAIGEAAERGQSCIAWYCDEDVLGPDGGYSRPIFKSRLNIDALYCRNWVGNLLAVERELCCRVAPPCDVEPAAWLYDLTLRVYEERPDGFAHVARVLHHALESPLGNVPESELVRALSGHLGRRGVSASVVSGPVEGSVRIAYELPDPRPLVSVVIPNKDRLDLLEPCVRSLLERGSYDALEVVVVENNSAEESTFSGYERLEREFPQVRVVRWDGPFNYSQIINFGASHATGEYLLLLNNDTELIDPASIQEMLGMLMRPEVGVVGAKLLFRDDLIQHAGMTIGRGDAVAHVNQNRYGDDGGYLQAALFPGNYSSVTGACQMVRAAVFDEVGGYDERFAVGFNDVDFCMRLQQAGYVVAYTPYAVFHHYEFSSRGREAVDPEKLARWKREQGLFLQLWPRPFTEGDPYSNPSFRKESAYCQLDC